MSLVNLKFNKYEKQNLLEGPLSEGHVLMTPIYENTIAVSRQTYNNGCVTTPI